jgi:hypothetical protein
MRLYAAALRRATRDQECGSCSAGGCRIGATGLFTEGTQVPEGRQEVCIDEGLQEADMDPVMAAALSPGLDRDLP